MVATGESYTGVSYITVNVLECLNYVSIQLLKSSHLRQRLELGCGTGLVQTITVVGVNCIPNRSTYSTYHARSGCKGSKWERTVDADGDVLVSLSPCIVSCVISRCLGQTAICNKQTPLVILKMIKKAQI